MMHVLERLRELAFLLWCCDMGPTATIAFRKLASMLAVKRSIRYSRCLFWLCCRLCFLLLRSAVMCLRGHRSSFNHPITSIIDLAYSEGRLESSGLNWMLVFPAVQHFNTKCWGWWQRQSIKPGKKNTDDFCSHHVQTNSFLLSVKHRRSLWKMYCMYCDIPFKNQALNLVSVRQFL